MCKKAKLLFASEQKADNFIRFNAEEIAKESEKVPVRSYYCKACGGWHVTNIPKRQLVRKKKQVQMNEPYMIGGYIAKLWTRLWVRFGYHIYCTNMMSVTN